MFVYVVIGIVLGAAMVYFLVTPARVNQATNENKDELKAKYEDISKLNIEISSLKESVEHVEAERDALQVQLGESAKSEETLSAYDTLFEAANKYMLEDKVGCADLLLNIGETPDASASFTALRTTLQNLTYTDAGTHYYNSGVQAYNEGNYDAAITMLTKVETYAPTNTYAMYCLARSYRLKNGDVNDENSIKYFNKVIEMEPNSEYATWATTYLTY